MHAVLVSLLARELERAFNDGDRVAFGQALRAMADAARRPRRAP